MDAPAPSGPGVAPPRTGPAHRTFQKPEPRATRRARRLLPALSLLLVCGLFAARCGRIAVTDSITSDESTHLLRCLHYWQTGDDLGMWELGAPRLPHLINALPSYLVLRHSGRMPVAGEGDARMHAIWGVVLSGSPRVLVPARCVAIACGVGLLLIVHWSVARRRGAWLGLVAATLMALVPEVVAHSSIAGSDIPFTASALLALVLMARYAERPSAGRWGAIALAVGLAWAMRHTAILLLPMAAVVHLKAGLQARRGGGLMGMLEGLLGTILAMAALTSAAFLVLWAGDGFGTIGFTSLAEKVPFLKLRPTLGGLDLTTIPVPTSILSLIKQIRHQGIGHEAVFCGVHRIRGWYTYFPVAFLLKTPIGLILLMALAAARLKPEDAWDRLTLAFLALLWVMLMRNRVNIGVRYALLTYPLLAPWLARLFEPRRLRDRVWGPVTALATAWFVAASLGCGDRCLSYFNECVGGPSKGWLYLADSNVDWGQDLDALGVRLKALGIKDVTTDISSERRLNVPGIYARPNPGRTQQVPAVTPPNRRLYDDDGGYLPVYTRYVAVSVSRLYGLYSQNDLSWLWTRKVVTRVNDSIFVFDMDTPADRPLWE